MKVKELIEELKKYDSEYEVEHMSSDTWDSYPSDVDCIEVEEDKKRICIY
ncbi:hypothetical protein [Clostridium baratii]